MDRRTKNVEIFEDSVDLMQKSGRLRKAIQESVKNQRLYLETAEVTVPERIGCTCRTVVSKKRSLEAASAYAKAGKKVAVLNFASSTNPGGGVTNGSSAQEECLCRCSTLYPCLDTDGMWNQFYKPHRNAGDPLYNDDCLYTPGVIVFKSDISFPERMEEEDWYQVDVITCAAPNLRNVPSNDMNPFAGNAPAEIAGDALYELHVKRLERVFRVAAANSAEVLILGAFGCGAFCNPPAVVAKAFKAAQEKYASYFETIEYAVFCCGQETRNYDAFCEVFDAEKSFDLSRFLEAHERDYKRALREVKAGRKLTHWMWYIFPQIAGLGFSRTSQFYAITDLGEAKAYLQNEVLGPHMKELCTALMALKTADATEVFGCPDDMKLKSSMTLFELADLEQKLFGAVLDKFFDGERDEHTLKQIRCNLQSGTVKNIRS